MSAAPPTYNDAIYQNKPADQPGYYVTPQQYNPPVNYSGPNTANPAIYPAPIDTDIEQGQANFSSFDEKSIRNAFIRKVYSIMCCQLLVTVALVTIFQFVPGVKKWVQNNIWFYIMAYVVFVVVYICLVCFRRLRQHFPQNFISLAIFTLAFSYMAATIASFHEAPAVLYALGITAVICIGITLFAFQTKIDFTLCSGLLFALCLTLMLFGFTTILVWRLWGSAHIMQTVYGGLGALVFSLFLVYDTQLVMGGKYFEISPEDYIEAALQLYLDVVYIFLFILQMTGGSKS